MVHTFYYFFPQKSSSWIHYLVTTFHVKSLISAFEPAYSLFFISLDLLKKKPFGSFAAYFYSFLFNKIHILSFDFP